MFKILFVCHGNICRSPMAEFVFKDIVQKHNMQDKFYINSKATSSEEIGNPIHFGTKDQLLKHNIRGFEDKRASKMTKQDYDYYDLIIIMDSYNLRNIKYIVDDKKGKIHKLLEYTNSLQDIQDPWYTGDFETTYKQIEKGCNALFMHLMEGKNGI